MPSNVNPIGQCLGGSFGQQAKLENVSVQTLEGMKQIFTAERKGLDATPPPLGRLPAWQMCNAPDGKWGATEVGQAPHLRASRALRRQREFGAERQLVMASSWVSWRSGHMADR